jgi:hypothetical protein
MPNFYEFEPVVEQESINIIDDKTIQVKYNGHLYSPYIKVEPNQKYTISMKHFDRMVRYDVRFYDKNKSEIGRMGLTLESIKTFPVPSNAFYLRWHTAPESIQLDVRTIKDLQLEKGDTATEYEPYKESIAYITAKDKDNKIVNLRSLPNGTKDEIRVSGGKAELIKRVNEVVLDGSENYDQFNAQTYSYRLRLTGWVTNNNAISNKANSGVGYAEDGNYRIYPSLSSTVDWKNIVIGAAQAPNNLYIYIPFSYVDNLSGKPSGTSTLDDVKNYLNQYPITLIYQLAEPEIIPVQVSGNIVSHPSGTVYFEHGTFVTGVYTENGINVMYSDLPIKSINKIVKIEYETGLEHDIDTSKAVISTDKLSFTHPELTASDIVFFDYDYDIESTEGEATIEYYDSRYTIKDSVTGKFYKWNVTVADGQPKISLVEV